MQEDRGDEDPPLAESVDEPPGDRRGGDDEIDLDTPVAEIAPAVAYDPVRAEMSSTTPMPSIDIGILPTKPAMTKPLTPGVLNSPR